jgi:hypothetical protein
MGLEMRKWFPLVLACSKEEPYKESLSSLDIFVEVSKLLVAKIESMIYHT